METKTVQTTGTYDPEENYFSISICPNNNHLLTFEGLTYDDMEEIKSLVDILLEDYKERNVKGGSNGVK